MSKKGKNRRVPPEEAKAANPQIIITFAGPDSLNFREQLIGIDPMQLAAAAIFLDEQARLAIRQKIMYSGKKRGPEIIVPGLRPVPKA